MANIELGKNITNTGQVADFLTTVVQFAYSSNPWSSSNMPRFTTGTGINGANAIPPTQLDSAVRPTVVLPDGNVSASTIVNTLINATRALTRIRACTSNGYYQSGAAMSLQQTLSGKAIFRPITVDNFNKTAYNPPANSNTTGTPWWAKSPNTTTMTQTLPAVDTSNIAEGKEIGATNLNAFIMSLRNAWNTTYNNRVTYNYYTCHSNCYTAPCNRLRR